MLDIFCFIKPVCLKIIILPSRLEAFVLNGIAISSVRLERASLYCAADQSFNLSSISGVQQVGPCGQICNDTPEIKKQSDLYCVEAMIKDWLGPKNPDWYVDLENLCSVLQILFWWIYRPVHEYVPKYCQKSLFL